MELATLRDQEGKGKWQGIEEPEKVRVMLAEYTSLRSEIIGRITNIYQVVGYASILLAYCILNLEDVRKLQGLVIVISLGIITCGRWLMFDIRCSARRVSAIEDESNRRAGERLLI